MSMITGGSQGNWMQTLLSELEQMHLVQGSRPGTKVSPSLYVWPFEFVHVHITLPAKIDKH